MAGSQVPVPGAPLEHCSGATAPISSSGSSRAFRALRHSSRTDASAHRAHTTRRAATRRRPSPAPAAASSDSDRSSASASSIRSLRNAAPFTEVAGSPIGRERLAPKRGIVRRVTQPATASSACSRPRCLSSASATPSARLGGESSPRVRRRRAASVERLASTGSTRLARADDLPHRSREVHEDRRPRGSPRRRSHACSSCAIARWPSPASRCRSAHSRTRLRRSSTSSGGVSRTASSASSAAAAAAPRAVHASRPPPRQRRRRRGLGLAVASARWRARAPRPPDERQRDERGAIVASQVSSAWTPRNRGADG